MLDKLNAIANYISKMTADAQGKKRQAAEDDVDENMPDNDADQPSSATRAKKSINKAMNMDKPE